MALGLGSAAVVAVGASPSGAATGPGPIVTPSSSVVTADALPTVQINGVVWSQAIIGNTVYAGGKFTTARPAGSPAGSNTVARSNLLAYDITTGQLITAFNPVVNAQVLTVSASPDGSRLYIGGDFTAVNGVTHNHIAALNPSTGAPISTFTANINAKVQSIISTASTVYAGGNFSAANGSNRLRLAAFASASGALTAWAPTAGSGYVHAMTFTPDKTEVVIGGDFVTLNNTTVYGIGAVSASTGALQTWKINQLLRDYDGDTDTNTGSAVTSLYTDGTYVYGSGYNYNERHAGRYEGAWAANPSDGSLHWLEDCHGDTYGVFAVNSTAYTVSHSHYCYDLGGTPDNTANEHHTMAFTQDATGTLLHYTAPANDPNVDFGGQPAPSIIDWFPDMTIGTYTGQNQAAWSITGNSTYIVEGGEFPTVNGTAQQGLVRFAVRGTTGNPGAQGPRLSGANFAPTLTSASSTAVTVSFKLNWDRDDMPLYYTLYRNGTALGTAAFNSEWWNLPTISYTDTGLTPGVTYTYQLVATDPHGKTATGSAVSIKK